MATSIIEFPARGGLEFSNATVDAAGVLTVIDETAPVVAFVDMLRVGVPHILSVSVTPTAFSGSSGFMIVDDKPHPLTLGVKATAADAFTPSGAPLRIELVNVAVARVRVLLDVLEDIPERVEPWQTLALEVFAPQPSDAFTWDTSRWDRAVLDVRPPSPNTLYWDTGAFDVNDWFIEQSSSAWQNIIDPVTKLTISRSVNALGPCFTAQTGTLNIEALNGLDPRALGVNIGAPVRLYDWQTRTPIFTGALSEAKTSRLKNGHTVTTWQVVDKVAYLAATQRYGAIPPGGAAENFDERIARLMKSDESTGRYTQTRYTIAGVVEDRATLYGPTVMETSLAKHLDAAVTTAGGFWYCRRDNWLSFSASPPADTPAVSTLSDSYDTENAWYYTSASSDWSTSALITSIEVNNHSAELDDKGQWRASDTSIRVASATWAAAFGGANVRADMTAATSQAAEARARQLLRAISHYPALTAAGLPIFTRADQLTALALDPVDAVKTVSASEENTAHITGLKHEISPREWRLNLRLQPQTPNDRKDK